MNKLLISSCIVLILTWITQGFSVLSICATVSTALFCGRKIGHFCRKTTLYVLEGIGLILTFTFRILFKSYSWKIALVALLLRAIFLGICLYDMTNFIYVKEIHRREDEV